MRRFYGVLFVAALVGGAAITIQLLGPDRAASTARAPAPPAAAAVPEVGAGVTRGADDAPVTIHEFADYQCPACARFAARAEPRLVREYVESGRVRYVFHDFPLVSIHRAAYAAALAARCAGGADRYWAAHDSLFSRRDDWARERRPIRTLAEAAAGAGVGPDSVEACIRAEHHRDAVLADLRQAERLGLRGTPTLFVGAHRIVGAVSYDSLRAVIEAELAATGAAPAPFSAGRPADP